MNLRAREFAKKWQEKWFGFWADEERVRSQPFSWEDHIDESWHPEDRDKLIDYLRNAPIALVAQQKAKKCPLCGDPIFGSCYRSDGDWLWTDPVAHYVGKHRCILPDRLVEHIRSKHHRPPTNISSNFKVLPWPTPL